MRGLLVLTTRWSRPNEARLTCAGALCWAKAGGIPDLPSKITISTAFEIATDRRACLRNDMLELENFIYLLD